MTTFNANVATTATLLPIVAQLAVALRVSPEAHMIACTWASSYSFMLPISTPPNAIAFATKVTAPLLDCHQRNRT
jgi:sodium-dependent dicarboxylate transporter 2/3/5